MIALLILQILSGCAHSGNLHPYLLQKGLLVPIHNPDGLIDNPASLTLYLGDVFNSRKEGGTLLFGHRMNEKLRHLVGGQALMTCRTVPCYAKAARDWNMTFLLSATIRKEDDSIHSKGILTLTRWSVDPLFPELTVPVVFSLGNPPPSYEALINHAVTGLMAQAAARANLKGKKSPTNETADLRRLIGEGKVDQALRIGESEFKNQSGSSRSKEFYATLYRLEMSAGKLKWARMVGEEAIRLHRASTALLLQMAHDARKVNEPNREQNILFQGLSLYPNDRDFWRQLIQEEIRKKEYIQAYNIIRLFEKRNPSSPGHPRFRAEVYASLVGMGKGDEADLWFRRYLEKSRKFSENTPKFLAHAIVSRKLQKGKWRKAEQEAKRFIAKGIRSSLLYEDWMTASGAYNNPIGEAHAAREAISMGFGSRWIRDQLAYLEQKGY